MKKLFMCMAVLSMVAGFTMGCQKEDTKVDDDTGKDVKEAAEAAVPAPPAIPEAPKVPKDHPGH